MSFVEAPLDCRDTWQRTCDELAESDLDGPQDDYDFCFGLLRKRPDALAFRCGSKSVPRLEHQPRAAGLPKSGNWSIAMPMGASCN